MIVLRNLTKEFYLHGQRKVVADNINAVFPSGVSVALLGANGAGKSTLLKMIAGTTHPTSGEVLSTGRVSFPVGLASSLHADLTGAQNTRFVARIYGADTDALMHWVEEFAELGPHYHLPVRSYSSGMRGRLSFGINMGLNFDTYLVDEVTAVGDAAFKRKSREVFLQRMERAGAIFVSHSMGAVREMCTAGALLENGKLTYFDDVEEAIDSYSQSLSGNRIYTSEPLPEGAASMNFPRDARMLFGIGLDHAGIGWIGDCLRRHRPCHFPKVREPHYFDIRAGQAPQLLERRLQTVRQLADRLSEETGAARANSVRLLSELGELLAIHTAPHDGPDRHDAYIDYLLTRRTSQPVICDFTPDYATLPEAELHEMATIGRAVFLLVLRDPVTRLWAELLARHRDPDKAARIGETMVDNPVRLARYHPQADYAAILARLDACLRPERLLLLFHETLTDEDTFERLGAFLDVPPVPESIRPEWTAPELPPLPADLEAGLARLLAPQYAAVAERLGALPAGWRQPPG